MCMPKRYAMVDPSKVASLREQMVRLDVTGHRLGQLTNFARQQIYRALKTGKMNQAMYYECKVALKRIAKGEEPPKLTKGPGGPWKDRQNGPRVDAQKVANEQRHRIIKLFYRGGWTQAEIALAVGVVESRVSEIITKHLDEQRRYLQGDPGANARARQEATGVTSTT